MGFHYLVDHPTNRFCRLYIILVISGWILQKSYKNNWVYNLLMIHQVGRAPEKGMGKEHGGSQWIQHDELPIQNVFFFFVFLQINEAWTWLYPNNGLRMVNCDRLMGSCRVKQWFDPITPKKLQNRKSIMAEGNQRHSEAMSCNFKGVVR